MLNKTLQAVLLLAILAYFAILIFLLKKNNLKLKYTLLWLFAGAVMLIMTLFPQLLRLFSNLVGIYTPVNAVFALVLFFVIIILVSLTAITSKLSERVKQMAQFIGLMEKRLRDIENGTDSSKHH